MHLHSQKLALMGTEVQKSMGTEVQKKTALLIDASEQLREQIFQLLQAPGWSIEEAPNNAAALELARSHAFDIIVTGQATPATADVQLLRCIRRLHPHTRVIILTEESTPEDVLEAMRQGAFSYFCHPISFAALSETLTDAIEAPAWDEGIEIVSATPNWVRFIVRCDVQTAERLLRFVHEMIELPDSERDVVAWALRELLMNSIEYGGKFDPHQYVEVQYLRTARAVACRVKDPGEGFSFDEIKHAAVSNPRNNPIRHLDYREADHLRAGGFGILLSRNMVDELIYNEKGNDVLLIKYVDKAPLHAA